jgi:hypothetical protein
LHVDANSGFAEGGRAGDRSGNSDGQIVMAIPYAVRLRFDKYSISSCAVFGCAVEEIGEFSIIGRDLMNRYQILFNGLASEFTVF